MGNLGRDRNLSHWGQIIAFWCVLFFSTSARAQSGLTFRVPPGWVDVSPGLPEGNLKRLPPQVRAYVSSQVKAGGFEFVAMDPTFDEYPENVNATLAGPPTPITAAALNAYRNAVEASDIDVLEAAVVPIEGVACGRFVTQGKCAAGVCGSIQYLIPATNHLVVLTYTTTKEAFGRFRSIFDDAARATQGVVRPSTQSVTTTVVSATDARATNVRQRESRGRWIDVYVPEDVLWERPFMIFPVTIGAVLLRGRGVKFTRTRSLLGLRAKIMGVCFLSVALVRIVLMANGVGSTAAAVTCVGVVALLVVGCFGLAETNPASPDTRA